MKQLANTIKARSVPQLLERPPAVSVAAASDLLFDKALLLLLLLSHPSSRPSIIQPMEGGRERDKRQKATVPNYLSICVRGVS